MCVLEIEFVRQVDMCISDRDVKGGDYFGPHPQPMFQVEISPEVFPQIIPWLMYNREGLTILIHPEAEDAYNDHAHFPLWMGKKLRLRLNWLQAGNRAA